MTEMYTSALAFILANMLMIFSLYVAGGIIYSFIKWLIVLVRIRKDVLNIRPDADQEYREKRKKAIAAGHLSGYSQSYPPQAKENIGIITVWAIFWPINLIWTLFADVAVIIWEYVVDKLNAFYNMFAKMILPS